MPGFPYPKRPPEVFQTLQARVHPRFKRAVIFGVLTLAAMYAGHRWGRVNSSSWVTALTGYALAVVVAVLGVITTRITAREVHRVIAHRASPGAAAPIRFVILVAGYLITAVVAIGLIGFDLSRLLVGGAVTGVILGVAGQQVLGNFFAGLVLLFTRPFSPGDYIKIRSGALGGPHEGTVLSIGLIFTLMQSTDGPVSLPNSGILAGAVGPAPRPPDATAARSDPPGDGSDRAANEPEGLPS